MILDCYRRAPNKFKKAFRPRPFWVHEYLLPAEVPMSYPRPSVVLGHFGLRCCLTATVHHCANPGARIRVTSTLTEEAR